MLNCVYWPVYFCAVLSRKLQLGFHYEQNLSIVKAENSLIIHVIIFTLIAEHRALGVTGVAIVNVCSVNIEAGHVNCISFGHF